MILIQSPNVAFAAEQASRLRSTYSSFPLRKCAAACVSGITTMKANFEKKILTTVVTRPCSRSNLVPSNLNELRNRN